MDTIMHKNIKGKITQKVLKRELSFLYATHLHDLFYILTVKYHQNIPNSSQVIERTPKYLRTEIRTDGRTPAHRYIPRTIRSGIINELQQFDNLNTNSLSRNTNYQELFWSLRILLGLLSMSFSYI